MDRGAWQATAHGGCKESDMTVTNARMIMLEDFSICFADLFIYDHWQTNGINLFVHL